MASPKVSAFRPDLPHLDGGKAGSPAEKIFRYGIEVRVSGFADEIKKDLHSGGISIIFALRQSRSKS